MDAYKCFSGHNLKNIRKKQKVGYAKKNVQSGWEIFTLSPVFYLTVGFNKLVSDLFHAYFGRKRVYQEKN